MRKAEFSRTHEALVPWAQFSAAIEPHYPKAGNSRPPVAGAYVSGGQTGRRAIVIRIAADHQQCKRFVSGIRNSSER